MLPAPRFVFGEQVYFCEGGYPPIFVEDIASAGEERNPSARPKQVKMPWSLGHSYLLHPVEYQTIECIKMANSVEEK